MGHTVARLPAAVREDLREPLGPVLTDVGELLGGAGDPLIAVGDVVTYHLLDAGHRPAVALIDERTEREATTGAVAATLADLDRDVTVPNEPGTLSEELIDALADAVESPDPTVIEVDGEEDLAALPAVLLAPDGATVVYGQPGEGMVRVTVSPETKATVRDLLERFETAERLWSLVE
ncbi:MAG: GTP-dependent dephospho-CoA kinase family protein [Halobacteriaceae archaeon]